MGLSFSELFDPSSHIFGAVSLLASLGTIIALIVTIKSVNETTEQNKLLSRRRALDNIFEEFKSTLNRIVFTYREGSVPVIYIGNEAILRAKYFNLLHIFKTQSNIEILEEYLNYVSVYSGTIMLILTKMDDTSRRIYEGKLKSEFRFIKEQVVPMIINSKNIALSNSSDIATRLDGPLELAKYIAGFEILNGKILDAK